MGQVHLRVDGVPMATLDKMYDHPGTAWFDSVVLHGTNYSLHHNRLLPQTKVWDYFREKYEIDPSRFTLWHPHLGRLLRLEKLELRNHTVAEQPLPSGVNSGAATPEPSSMILLAIGIAGFFWWKSMRDH